MLPDCILCLGCVQEPSQDFSLFAAESVAEAADAPHDQPDFDYLQSRPEASAPHLESSSSLELGFAHSPTTGAYAQHDGFVSQQVAILDDQAGTKSATLVESPSSSFPAVEAVQHSSTSDTSGKADTQEEVMPQQSAELLSTVAQLRQQFAAVQQRLAKSDAECVSLKAMLTANEDAAQTSEQTHAKLEQHWRSQAQQHQQQLRSLHQQLAQQQERVAEQATSSTAFKQELYSSQQQAQSLQQQLSQQQEQLQEAESTVQDLEAQLHAAQEQAASSATQLKGLQHQLDTVKQQLTEQQQGSSRSQQMQHSMQAELREAQAERDSLQEQLEAAQQQAVAGQQSLQDRDGVWQEELQQQQSRTDKLQLVRVCTRKTLYNA